MRGGPGARRRGARTALAEHQHGNSKAALAHHRAAGSSERLKHSHDTSLLVWLGAGRERTKAPGSPLSALLPGPGHLVDLQRRQLLGHAVLPKVEGLFGRGNHVRLGHGDEERL